MPTPLLQSIETAVTTALSTLLVANGGLLNEVNVESFPQSFESPEQISEFLKRFAPRIPCGFLTPPEELGHNESPANAIKVNFDCQFQFLALFTTRYSTASRRTQAYTTRDTFITALQDRQLTAPSGYEFSQINMGNRRIIETSEYSAYWAIFSFYVRSACVPLT